MSVGLLVVLSLLSVRDDSACPREDGCIESCGLPDTPAQSPSDTFLAKLKSVSSTGFHIDSVLGAALLQRRSQFHVANMFGFRDMNLWNLNGRYAGPCANLVAVFWSKLVDDHDRDSVIELYELRYRAEVDARRVSLLLNRSWDWNYHPMSAVQAGRSVFVIEGRHRDWSGQLRVARHFGAQSANSSLKAARAPLVAPEPLCDREGKVPPLLEVPGDGAHPPRAVFLLGFSSAGRLAWLERRAANRGDQLAFSLQITDLADDRQLESRTVSVRREQQASLCSRHDGDEMARLLNHHAIDRGLVPVLETPGSGTDRLVVEVAPARASGGFDLAIKSAAGSKRIATLAGQAQQPPRVVGVLRSPFESRVAVVVLEQGRVRFIGARLDSGWRADR
jgi:hypothetical protein